MTVDEKKAKRRAYDKVYYESHQEEIRARKKAYDKANPEKSRAIGKTYRERNREKVRARRRAWYVARREEVKAQVRAYREINREKLKAQRDAHPEKVRAQWDKSKYGLGPTARQEMYERQGGRCAICGDHHPFTGHGGLHIDHNHHSNLVRGMLCHGCNTGLGKFKDNPELLRAAADYLVKSTAT